MNRTFLLFLLLSGISIISCNMGKEESKSSIPAIKIEKNDSDQQ